MCNLLHFLMYSEIQSSYICSHVQASRSLQWYLVMETVSQSNLPLGHSPNLKQTVVME